LVLAATAKTDYSHLLTANEAKIGPGFAKHAALSALQ
jgi:hypothetical protein